MDVIAEFQKIRRVGTPWTIVNTPDYRVVAREFMKVRYNGEDEEPPSVFWDFSRGHTAANEIGKEAAAMLGEPEETANAPAFALKMAMRLPPNTVFFMVFPTAETLQDVTVMQAMANLRDEFKSDKRTLVVLTGRGVQAGSLVVDDIPVLREELPDEETIEGIILRTTEELLKLPVKQVKAAVPYCKGLTSFMVEEGISRNISKKGLDLQGLVEMQRSVVEQSTDRALVFEKETWTFEQVGGLHQFKNFLGKLFAGPKPPKLIVRVDEIDKSVTAASTGAIADNTGTSQDQLKVFLTSMEENKWTGCLLVGCPGSGKTLSTICAGNEFQSRTLVFDAGATKDSLVGASERKIRTVMDVLKAIGGEDVLFLATANRLDTLPPELQRRFSLGTWYFSVPTTEELAAIWKIQMERYGLEESAVGPKPSDVGWVGSDVRNCCRLAWMLATTLKEAAGMITIVGKSAAKDIERLEEMAETRGFLCANKPGPYQRPAKKTGRAIRL